jgi:hypothetical protein
MSGESSYENMSDFAGEVGSTKRPSRKEGETCVRRMLCNKGTLCLTGFIFGILTMAILEATVLSPRDDSAPANKNGTTSSVGCSQWGDMEKVVKIGTKEFLDHESSCGKSSWGAKDKTAECLMKATGISLACADCYGEQTACGAKHCALVCAFGADDKCVACVCKHCRAAFLKCNKLPCTLLPANACKDCPNYQPF